MTPGCLLLYLETFNFVYYIPLHFSNSQVRIAVNSHYTPFKRFTPLDIISLQISPQALLSFMSIKCYQNRLGSFNNRHLACLQNKDVCSIATHRCQHKRKSFRNCSGADRRDLYYSEMKVEEKPLLCTTSVTEHILTELIWMIWII